LSFATEHAAPHAAPGGDSTGLETCPPDIEMRVREDKSPGAKSPNRHTKSWWRSSADIYCWYCCGDDEQHSTACCKKKHDGAWTTYSYTQWSCCGDDRHSTTFCGHRWG
jgi:hypothetical protein